MRPEAILGRIPFLLLGDSMKNDDREKELVAILVKGQAILARTSPQIYGSIKIREYRRDFASGQLDEYLTTEEIKTLKAVQDIEAEIIARNKGMIYLMANNVNINGFDRDDLFQEACVCIVLSMYGYDGSSNINTYFNNIAKNAMLDKVNLSHRKKRKSNQIHDYDLNLIPQNEKEITEGDPQILKQAISMILPSLTPLEKATLELFPIMGRGFLSTAANKTINPITLKPYTTHNAKNAWGKVKRKLRKAYDDTIRQKRQVA